MRILLIEDDMLIGDGIKTGLSKMGFSVDWFTQGRQGKEALYSAPYDAVILDLTLPGMDGRDISHTVWGIIRHWLPASGEKMRKAPILFHYTNLAEGVTEQRLETDVYVPLA